MYGRQRGGFALPRRGRGRNGTDMYLIMLVMQLLGQIQRLERKPPITLFFMAFMAALFFFDRELWPGGLSGPFALCPHAILWDGQWMRLIVSAFIHADQWHLYHNMSSLLWKGMQLEFKLGPEKYLKLLLFSLVGSHGLYLIISWALAEYTPYTGSYYGCAVGFSAILFSMKMVLNYNAPSMTSIYGIRLPTKYAAWLELVICHYLIPQSSFLGHMCGVVTGYMYLKWQPISDFLRRLLFLATPVQPSYKYAQRASGQRESDEEMARRMQDEEYKKSMPNSNASSNAASDLNELRRRRLNRLG